MISADRRDSCLNYLSDTDKPYAHAKMMVVKCEDQKATILAREFLHSDQKTMDAKKADSYTSPAYREWREGHRNAVYDFEILRNQRINAALIIELWRSEFSARKMGIVV